MGYMEEMEMIMRNLDEYDKRQREEMRTLWVIITLTVMGFISLIACLIWM